jgi:hypothetical protein
VSLEFEDFLSFGVFERFGLAGFFLDLDLGLAFEVLVNFSFLVALFSMFLGMRLREVTIFERILDFYLVFATALGLVFAVALDFFEDSRCFRLVVENGEVIGDG